MARAMGIDPATQKYVPFDITNKKFATNYMDILHHPLEKQGVDFWWLDWQSEPTTPIAGLTPTWWLNYVHFTDQEREGKRPLLFHRWGGLGNHRYEIGFSGDTISSWDSLAFQPWFTATAANVGYAYWSHDIGGHIPGVIEPELYARWVQFGAFSPILRTHTTSNPDAERRLWAYPEPYSDVMRDAFQMRYALQPYLYTEARRTYDTGVAFLRPLYYDWPNAEQAYSSRGEYVFGDSMIVAPVVKPVDKGSSLATEDVWLPEGEWVEWFTGKRFTGPVKMTRSFSITQIPLYVRSGAVIPMMPKMEYTGQKPVDPLIVNVLPLKSGQSSTYSVYEDSGKAEEYQTGAFTRTMIMAKRMGDTEQVTLQPVTGRFDGMLEHRGMQLRLPGYWPPDSVTVGGRSLGLTPTGKAGWHFDGNTLTTTIDVPARPVNERVVVEVHRAEQLTRRDSELDGFAGAMTRYAEAMDAANHQGAGTFAPDELILLAQTGDRIKYRPETTGAEIAKLPERYTAALNALNKMLQQTGASQSLLSNSTNAEAERAHRNLFLQRAIDLLKDAPPAGALTNTTASR
jgi:alpha-glucosidase